MLDNPKFNNKCLHYLQTLLPHFKLKNNVMLNIVYSNPDKPSEYINLPSELNQNFSITSLDKSTKESDLYSISLEYEFWKEASELELKGILAHELTHLEFKSNIEPLKLFSVYKDSFTYNCLEYIINYSTMAHGFVLETIAYRKFVLSKAGIQIGVPEPDNFISTFKKSLEFEVLDSTKKEYNFKNIKDVYPAAYAYLIHQHI